MARKSEKPTLAQRMAALEEAVKVLGGQVAELEQRSQGLASYGPLARPVRPDLGKLRRQVAEMSTTGDEARKVGLALAAGLYDVVYDPEALRAYAVSLGGRSRIIGPLVRELPAYVREMAAIGPEVPLRMGHLAGAASRPSSRGLFFQLENMGRQHWELFCGFLEDFGTPPGSTPVDWPKKD
jgi:hypothetical protein